MRPALFTRFLEKSEEALLSAIEVYNKPIFRYKEETFSILAINAWELLFKAKILKDNKNNLKTIREYEHRTTKAKSSSKKLYIKKNRTGNPITLGILKCINKIDGSSQFVPTEVKANIEALIEIRDNAAHYLNPSTTLARQVFEISSATIKNYVTLSKTWFGRDVSSSVSLFLPLAFIKCKQVYESAVVSPDEKRLIEYLDKLALKNVVARSQYSVAIKVHVKFERSKLSGASKVQVSNDPDAIKISLTEEDLRERYPWDYNKLTKHLKERYSDFKENNKYHSIRKPLVANNKYAYERFLDKDNPKSGRKTFYSEAFLSAFDKHYKKSNINK